jgi:hypothetical protein
MKLTDLKEGVAIDVAMWDTRDDFDNGNGARAFVSNGTLELVDQGYGWEYRVVAPDDTFICFNADEVLDITDPPNVLIRVICETPNAVIFFLAYAAHDLCILDEGDDRYNQLYVASIEALRNALPADDRKFLLEWLDDDDPCLLTDWLETTMNTYNVGGWL